MISAPERTEVSVTPSTYLVALRAFLVQFLRASTWAAILMSSSSRLSRQPLLVPLSCHTSDQDFNRSSHGGSWGRQVPRAGRVYAGGVM
jgi:hypothetical protein